MVKILRDKKKTKPIDRGGSLKIDSRALVGTIDDVLIVSRWQILRNSCLSWSTGMDERDERGNKSGGRNEWKKGRRRSRILYGFGGNSRTRVVERSYLHPSRISIIERYSYWSERIDWGIMTSCQGRSAAWSPVNYTRFADQLFVERKKKKKRGGRRRV